MTLTVARKQVHRTAECSTGVIITELIVPRRITPLLRTVEITTSSRHVLHLFMLGGSPPIRLNARALSPPYKEAG